MIVFTLETSMIAFRSAEKNQTVLNANIVIVPHYQTFRNLCSDHIISQMLCEITSLSLISLMQLHSVIRLTTHAFVPLCIFRTDAPYCKLNYCNTRTKSVLLGFASLEPTFVSYYKNLICVIRYINYT